MREIAVAIMDNRLAVEANSVTACIRCIEAAALYPVPAGTLEVAFVDEAECRRLHGSFFGDPDITDVMTFPGDPDDGHAGDIAICPAVAHAACAESGLPFNEELTLYLVHAWLHLSGLDDRTTNGAREMRGAESRLMMRLREERALLRAAWLEQPAS